MKRTIVLGLTTVMSLGATFLIVSPLVLIFGYPYILPPPDPACGQREVFSYANSPDGAWIARFYRNGCGGGFGTGYNNITVEIIRPEDTPHPYPAEGVVFLTDDRSYGLPEPFALRWLGEKKLEITIPEEARGEHLQNTYADLAISYRYLNVDSIGRTCQKEWRSQPNEDLVHQSLSAKDSIAAFYAQCFEHAHK